MAFGIDGEPQARFADRAFLANAGDDVGERPPCRHVIKHIIDGDERRAEPFTEFSKEPKPARLIAAIIVDAGEKGAARCGVCKDGEAENEIVIPRCPRLRMTVRLK